MKNVFLILLFLVAACKKKQEPPSALLPDFPNEIGDHWRYRYNPGSGPFIYIDVDIVGTRIMPDGQSAKIWLYKYLSYTDTTFVVSDGQVAKIYGNIYSSIPPPYYEIMHYSFPLQVGTIYAYPVPAYYRDTSKVLENSPLTVPAGTFNNTFKISKTREYIVNSWTSDTIWFAPTVGMIKSKIGEYDLGPAALNGIWELTEYSLH
jgi:hypothetical protein